MLSKKLVAKILSKQCWFWLQLLLKYRLFSKLINVILYSETNERSLLKKIWLILKVPYNLFQALRIKNYDLIIRINHYF